MPIISVSSAVTFVALLSMVVAKNVTPQERKDLKCAVCRALVYEVNVKVEAVPASKKVEVGSYRIDAKGNQGTRMVSYARSETHLVEVMESICTEIGKYGTTTLKTGKSSLMPMTHGPTASQHIKRMQAQDKDKPVDKSIMETICEDTLGEYDDDISEVYRNTDVPLSDIESSVCLEGITNYCTADDLEIKFPHTDDDLSEAAKVRDDSALNFDLPKKEDNDEEKEDEDKKDEESESESDDSGSDSDSDESDDEGEDKEEEDSKEEDKNDEDKKDKKSNIEENREEL